MSHPGLCNRCAYLSHCSAFHREASTLSETPHGKMFASEPGPTRRNPVQGLCSPPKRQGFFPIERALGEASRRAHPANINHWRKHA